jgi:RecB family exonuclease
LDAAASTPLIIQFGAIEVRIGGRIDRIDVTEFEDGSIGFWVIDYKTGRGNHHTGPDLAAMKKLQLSLYALAVERLHFPSGRPLGLAYWMVADGGPKVALPSRSATAWLAAADRWPRFRDQLERWVATLAGEIRAGAFPLQPRAEDCTSTCPYGQICRIADSRAVEKTAGLPLPVVSVVDGANADE